jgi:hypothetical protein
MHRRGRPGTRTGAAKAAPHYSTLGYLPALGRSAFFRNQPTVAIGGPVQGNRSYAKFGRILSGF